MILMSRLQHRIDTNDKKICSKFIVARSVVVVAQIGIVVNEGLLATRDHELRADRRGSRAQL